MGVVYTEAKGGRTFLDGFHFRILLLILCAQRSGVRFVCIFFFSLIYRGKFKGDRTEVGLFIYLIYTLLRMYFLRSYSWKYLFSYSFLIRGGYEDRKIFRF